MIQQDIASCRSERISFATLGAHTMQSRHTQLRRIHGMLSHCHLLQTLTTGFDK